MEGFPGAGGLAAAGGGVCVRGGCLAVRDLSGQRDHRDASPPG